MHGTSGWDERNAIEYHTKVLNAQWWGFSVHNGGPFRDFGYQTDCPEHHLNNYSNIIDHSRMDKDINQQHPYGLALTKTPNSRDEKDSWTHVQLKVHDKSSLNTCNNYMVTRIFTHGWVHSPQDCANSSIEKERCSFWLWNRRENKSFCRHIKTFLACTQLSRSNNIPKTQF